jgi:hypothetical protein
MRARPVPRWAPRRPALINDDTTFLGLMQELLEGEGYDLATCTQWQDAHGPGALGWVTAPTEPLADTNEPP